MFGGVFPGQGSQNIGMGRFLYDNFKTAKYLFELSSDVLKQNLFKLIFESSEKELSLTENTQPTLFLISTIYEKIIKETCGLSWNGLSGHSIGEYAALVAANVLNYDQALLAVKKRGQFMQEAVPVGHGGMLVVLGLNDKDCEHLCQLVCKESGHSPLSSANFNCNGQIVISGSLQAIEWINKSINQIKQWFPNQKIKFITLNVSAPFHCELMKSAEQKMHDVLNAIQFNKATVPVVQNVDGLESQDPAVMKEKLIRQISLPVRWIQCVQRLKYLNIKYIVELGPGQVLAGLIKKIDNESLTTFNVNSINDLKNLETIANKII